METINPNRRQKWDRENEGEKNTPKSEKEHRSCEINLMDSVVIGLRLITWLCMWEMTSEKIMAS